MNKRICFKIMSVLLIVGITWLAWMKLPGEMINCYAAQTGGIETEGWKQKDEAQSQAVLVIDAEEKILEISEEYVITSGPVTFQLDPEEKGEQERFVYQISKDGGDHYSAILPMKEDTLIIEPNGGAEKEYVKLRFYRYQNESGELKELTDHGRIYGICFCFEMALEKTVWNQEIRISDEMAYFNKEGLCLDIYPSGRVMLEMAVEQNGRRSIYKITEPKSIEFTEGTYTIDLYFSADEKIEHLEGFPMQMCYDITPPSNIEFQLEGTDLASIYEDDNNSVITGKPLQVTVTAEDEGSGIEKILFYADGKLQEESSILLKPPFQGKLYAVALDKAGNKSALIECIQTIIVEKDAPEISLEYTKNDDNELELGICVEDVKSGILSVKAMLGENQELLSDVSLEKCKTEEKRKEYRLKIEKALFRENAKVLTVEAVDYAGNCTKQEYSLKRVDLKKPNIEITGVSEGEIYNQEIGLCIAVEDACIRGEDIVIEARKTLRNQTEVKKMDPKDSFVFSENGKYEVTVTATDVAGNCASKLVNFIIDKDAPAINGLQDYQGKTIERFFVAEKMSDMFEDDTVIQYRLYLNGKDFDENEVVTEPGKYTIQVFAIDQAGNDSTDQAEFVIENEKSIILAGKSKTEGKEKTIIEKNVMEMGASNKTTDIINKETVAAKNQTETYHPYAAKEQKILLGGILTGAIFLAVFLLLLIARIISIRTRESIMEQQTAQIDTQNEV